MPGKLIVIIMSAIFLTVGNFIISSCQQKTEPPMVVTDNAHLEMMAIKDQEIRQVDTLDWEPIDKTHRQQVMELLANGLIKTNQDKLNAALILQHTALTFCEGKLVSISPENYYLAYQLSKSAFDSGEKSAANMTATTLDRYLLYTEGYQKYGTQKVFDEASNDFIWAPIDTATTDSERAVYQVKPLDELLKESKMKNLEVDKNDE